jgi:hypothetical protein
MLRYISTIGRAPIMIALLLVCALLAACGSATPAATEGGYGSDAAPASDTAAGADIGSSGIDLAKLDVCATMPRAQLERAIGALVEAPKPTISIGTEVGCEYVVDQGRGYSIVVLGLDRWDIIPTFVDGATPIEGLGDGAYTAKEVGGGTSLYVLLRDRAVVNVRVNGADTLQLRQVVDIALANLR